MNLYIKQKVFSWTDKFTIRDEAGNVRFTVGGEFLSLGKALHIYAPHGEEVALVHRKFFSLLPRFRVIVHRQPVAEVVKEFTFFHPRYRTDGLGWVISGDFLAHNYSITARDTPIATIDKAWMSWGNCYALDIADSRNQVLALVVVSAVDCGLGQNAGVGVCASST